MRKLVANGLALGVLHVVLSCSVSFDGGGPMPLCLPSHPCTIGAAQTELPVQ
jgi:hypothetical protein